MVSQHALLSEDEQVAGSLHPKHHIKMTKVINVSVNASVNGCL